MVPTDSDNTPDKRSRAKPESYLENWIERQSLVESMIPGIGKWHRNNVRILLYGNPLMNLSVIEIMQLHRKVREVEANELSEYENYGFKKGDYNKRIYLELNSGYYIYVKISIFH